MKYFQFLLFSVVSNPTQESSKRVPAAEDEWRQAEFLTRVHLAQQAVLHFFQHPFSFYWMDPLSCLSSSECMLTAGNPGFPELFRSTQYLQLHFIYISPNLAPSILSLHASKGHLLCCTHCQPSPETLGKLVMSFLRFLSYHLSRAIAQMPHSTT